MSPGVRGSRLSVKGTPVLSLHGNEVSSVQRPTQPQGVGTKGQGGPVRNEPGGEAGKRVEA